MLVNYSTQFSLDSRKNLTLLTCVSINKQYNNDQSCSSNLECIWKHRFTVQRQVPMAIKKSELYSSLWSSCDELRGGMDASQYKDYVLVMLFIKYISDKYAGVKYAPIEIPKGASFKDMVALKGKPGIGDHINKKIIGPLEKANKLSGMPDFDDEAKLGSGKELVDRLTNLIAIFENPNLDFSKNRADGDDILGDAYEYLMVHFASESGKSKGQFYTPSEVSRIMAQIVGIHQAKTTNKTTVYDPTCGSGSLLLKVGDQADADVTLYGQEKDSATSGLARMNMILHNNPTAEIKQANTLANPLFKDGERLKTFDYVVANPPFSDKRWSNGINPLEDPYRRFIDFGVPPARQGDYAYLLHIISSLKSKGKGACILPHGVLFRGNAEADIRRNLVRKGYVKGIIGLPTNLFYGTGIAACIIVIDKENANSRKGIFMIDASSGLKKDGNKNRLRDRDIHLIVDVFNNQREIDHYSRMVSFEEIEKHEFNLNIPRYIENLETEDIQDIEGHLRGGIPERDIDALKKYWEVCPNLRKTLFSVNRPGYLDLKIDKEKVRKTIFQHQEFVVFVDDMNNLFSNWKDSKVPSLKSLEPGFSPKELIEELSGDLLTHYSNKSLIGNYDIYQHLMDYWTDTMQDDCYQISADGWHAETYRIIGKNKKGKQVDKGWTCDLVPKQLIIEHYFKTEQELVNKVQSELEILQAKLHEFEEENSGEDGVISDLEKINKKSVSKKLKELKKEIDDPDDEEIDVINTWLIQNNQLSKSKKELKTCLNELDEKVYVKYPELSKDEIKKLVVDDKWVAYIDSVIRNEIDRISQGLAQRVNELAKRYDNPLPKQTQKIEELEKSVLGHLKSMGFAW